MPEFKPINSEVAITSLPSRNVVTKARLGGKEFLYNPNEFTDNIGVEYSDIKAPGMSYPIIGYAGGKTRTIQFTIYLNGRDPRFKNMDEGAEYVKQWIAHLHSYIPPAGGTQFRSPPRLEFAFGWFVKETLLQDMQIRYKAFTPNLQPLEAEVDITLIIIQ